jgi:hypothetical protein
MLDYNPKNHIYILDYRGSRIIFVRYLKYDVL